MSTENKEIAVLFGFYKLNVFDVKAVKLAKLLNSLLSFLLLLLGLFVIYKFALNEAHNGYIPNLFGEVILASSFFFAVIVISSIVIVIRFCIFCSEHIDAKLNKINADHLINEFDYEKNPFLGFLVKEGVEEAGFFSAKTYWKIYYANIAGERCLENNKAKIQKNKDIRHKYKEFF